MANVYITDLRHVLNPEYRNTRASTDCAEIGFDLAQGFFFGVPRPIGYWLSPDRPR